MTQNSHRIWNFEVDYIHARPLGSRSSEQVAPQIFHAGASCCRYVSHRSAGPNAESCSYWNCKLNHTDLVVTLHGTLRCAGWTHLWARMLEQLCHNLFLIGSSWLIDLNQNRSASHRLWIGRPVNVVAIASSMTRAKAGSCLCCF